MAKNDDFELPTTKDDQDKIKNSLCEISAQRQMIKDRQEAIKDIVSFLKDEHKMPLGLINKLVKAIDDAEYVRMTTENSFFELVRETLLGDAGLPSDTV